MSVVVDAKNYTINSAGVYKITTGYTGTITINTTEPVTIDGAEAGTLSNVSIIVSSTTSDLTIKDLDIQASFWSGNIIKFGTGINNKLTILGTNRLNTTVNRGDAVIHVGGGLTIDGTGSLEAILNSNAFSGINSGSAIGNNQKEESKANIVINGGIITASACYTYYGGVGYSEGAGIGSGANGSIGNIIINGGKIISTAYYGAGIGSGKKGSVGNISIGGDAVVVASNLHDGFGIGAGYQATEAGTISFEKNITTSDKNIITINSRNTTESITINGKTYNSLQLVFENAELSYSYGEIHINDAKDKIITGNSDDEFFSNAADMVKIYALEGNDTIRNFGNYVTISSGAGNDSISNSSVFIFRNFRWRR